MGRARDLALGTLAKWLERKQKPDPKIWIFSSADNTKFNYNSRYLFEYVLSSLPEVRPVYVVNDDEKRQKLAKEFGPEHVAETRTLSGMRQVLAAGVWFTSAGLPVYARGVGKKRLIINLWHGIPLKRIVLLDPHQSRLSRLYFKKIFSDNYTWILTTSSHLVSVMAESFGVEEKKIRVWGQPRDDALLKEYRAAAGREGFHVLYAPTFRDEEATRLFPFPDLDLPAMEAFLQKNDCTLWLRLHPMDTADPRSCLSEHIRLFGEEQAEDATELLHDFDVLVTDYSSIYLDALLLDIPLIFLPYDREIYLARRGFNFPYDEVTPGPKPDTQAAFLQALEESLHGQASFREKRAAVRDFFHEIKTPCCGRICAEVSGLTDPDSHEKAADR